VSQSGLVESDWSVTENVPAARKGLMEPLPGNFYFVGKASAIKTKKRPGR